MIGIVIGWKFNNQAGMSTDGGIITEFPGGVPSQADQDLWTAEYEAWKGWDDVRQQRNTLISATDWRVLPDQPVSQPWLDYRQALRDVTNVATPDLVVWPVEPV